MTPQILRLYHRASKGDRLSREEIGLILGCSREKVRDIEKRAMAKLRGAIGSPARGRYYIIDSEGVPEIRETKKDWRR